jgi:hypothetical protein
MQFITRTYNHIVVDPRRGSVVKTSATPRLADEISFYESIPRELQCWFPRLIDAQSSPDGGDHRLELEFYAYPNLGTLLLSRALSYRSWEKIAARLTEMLRQFEARELNVYSHVAEAARTSMYIEKTWREYESLVAQAAFREALMVDVAHEATINNKRCLLFEEWWRRHSSVVVDTLCTKEPLCFMHGDLCFSNILVGCLEDEIALKVIDPRGTFGVFRGYGDRLYDLGKLMHSTDASYERIITDNARSTLSSSGGEWTVTSFSNWNHEQAVAHDILTSVLYSGYDPRVLKLVEGLIYIGMCARHYDCPERQRTMYLSGVSLLNEVTSDS